MVLTYWHYDKLVGADNGASALMAVPCLVMRGIAYLGLEFNGCNKL
jgi:hypothetical protein